MKKKQYIPTACRVHKIVLQHLAANSPKIPISDKPANKDNGQLSKDGSFLDYVVGDSEE